MSFFVSPRILLAASFFCGVRHPPAREAFVPGTFACPAVCFVMSHRLNVECLPCTRWLIACVCTCEIALYFWVLIMRGVQLSIHLRCASCSSVSNNCWRLDDVEKLAVPSRDRNFTIIYDSCWVTSPPRSTYWNFLLCVP